MSGIDGCYFEEDWGFLQNETKEGITFEKGTCLIQQSVMLTKEENEILTKMAEDMDMSTHGVLKQALRVLQMYRVGRLAPVLDDIGGCDAGI